MKTTVIHHSADFDGIFCREIARKFLPDAELIGWDFKDEPLDSSMLHSDQLVILDLPFDRPFGLQFKGGWICRGDEEIQPIDRWDSKNITWIDHHKSSIESHPVSIPGYRIDGVAACRLAWQWFNQLDHLKRSGYHNPTFEMSKTDLPYKDNFIDRHVEEPLAVRLAGEYDIWDKRDPRADILQFGLRSTELTDGDWRQLLSLNERPSIEEVEKLIDVGHAQNLLEPDGTSIPVILHGLLKDGELLQKYQQRNDAGTMHRSFMVSFDGLNFLALNTARCNSLTFATKDIPETGHDALMGFYFDGSNWNVSLYHANHRKDLDLSLIAVKHGGGGHRGACGFKSEHLPFGVRNLRVQLIDWLNTKKITSENIGEIRRGCFVPWESEWNGLVRDETAARENKP